VPAVAILSIPPIFALRRSITPSSVHTLEKDLTPGVWVRQFLRFVRFDFPISAQRIHDGIQSVPNHAVTALDSGICQHPHNRSAIVLDIRGPFSALIGAQPEYHPRRGNDRNTSGFQPAVSIPGSGLQRFDLHRKKHLAAERIPSLLIVVPTFCHLRRC
jgi:hypothetical protein